MGMRDVIKEQEEEGLAWWRVEMDKTGGVRNAWEVEYVSTPERVVGYVYVRANDKAGAVAKAIKWWKKRTAANNARSKAKFDKRRAESVCVSCGSPELETGRLCAKHAQLQREAALRYKARGAGEDVTLMNRQRGSDPEGQFSRYMDSARAKKASCKARGGQSGCVYRVCLDRLDRMSPSKYRAWLVSEINKRSDAEHQIPDAPAWHPPMVYEDDRVAAE